MSGLAIKTIPVGDRRRSTDKATVISRTSVICAIDFGTAYSGYAFKVRESAVSESNDIKMCDFQHGNRFKTSTSILLDDFKRTIAFGDKAQTMFYNYEPEDANNVHFYEKFKMVLRKTFDQKGLTSDTEIEDHRGRKTNVMLVISRALRFLADHFMERCTASIGISVSEEMVQWVITVPAIWNDAAREFMRKASYKAGLASEEERCRVDIALEPEVAGLFCRSQPVKKFDGRTENLKTMEAGDQFIIMDNGGGTIDIAVHEVASDKSSRGLEESTGGPWGGENVNDAFFALLDKVYGRSIMQLFEDKHSPQFCEFRHTFEISKHGWDISTSDDLKIQMPYELADIIRVDYSEKETRNIPQSQAMEAATRAYPGPGVSYKKGMLLLTNDVAETLFTASVTPTMQHLETLLRRRSLRHGSRLFMVGGFSNCTCLVNAVRRTVKKVVGDRIQVLVPMDAGAAVMKGAVLFGEKPDMISERIAPLTYGVSVTAKFDPKQYDPKRMYKTPKGKFVDDVFCIIVKRGTVLKLGKEQEHHLGYQEDESWCDERMAKVKIVASEKTNPTYVDEDGVKEVGTLSFHVPRTSGTGGCDIKFNFAKAEITVVGEDTDSKQNGKTAIEFLAATH